MRAIGVALLLAAIGSEPRSSVGTSASAFQILRPVTIGEVSGADEPDACAVLDADVFARASPTLSDLRLFSAGRELPYALTLSRTASTTDPARIENLRLRGNQQLGFDVVMPARPYSSLDLDVSVRDFVATARVQGLQRAGDLHPIYLGTFSLFDLSTRGLGRYLAMPLPESTFPLLRVDLAFAAAPGARAPKMTRDLTVSAQVPPTREAQTLYTPVAQLTSFTARGNQLIASMTLPAHVPLERVAFALNPQDTTNFSRAVTITATPLSTDGDQTGAPEVVTGRIERVQMTLDEQGINERRLAVPFALGANARTSAAVEIALDSAPANPGQPPLVPASVTLEMRQRKICFAAPDHGQPVILAYAGEPSGPVSNDFARTFDPSQPVRAAELGPEQRNAAWHPLSRHVRARPWRSPQFLLAALLAALSTVGATALHFTRKAARRR